MECSGTCYDMYSGVEGYTGTDGHQKIKREAIANMVGDYLFTDKNFISHLAKNQNVFQKVWNEIKYMVKVARAGSNEAKKLLQVQKAFEEAYREVTQKAGKVEQSQEQKNTAEDGGVRYSLSQQGTRQITTAMTDTQRSMILQTKNIIAPVYSGEADVSIANESDLESGRSGLVKAALVRIGEEFDVFTDYNIEDIDVQITLSRGNLRESVTKDANPVQLAKLLPILKETVENAIGIESHANRYHYDNTTESFDNLLGGYIDGDYFVPVRFGLKHIKGGETVLYVVVDQQKIKAEVLKTTTQQNDGSAVSRSAFTYNVPQVVSLVNSKDLLRYLPDDMLSTEQKKIKQEGIAETVKYTNDKNDAKYAKYIASGNYQAVQAMVDAAAKAAGYTIKAYHGTDADTFTVFDKGRIGEASGLSILGDGFYFSDKKSVAAQYGKNVYTVYLKQQNPYSATDSDTYKLNALRLVTDGFDGVTLQTGKGTIYMVLDPEQIKSADPVTYDDDGNVIPLSERFKAENDDIRYSLSNEDTLPVEYGNYRVSGEEIAFEDMLPMREIEEVLEVLERMGASQTEQDVSNVAEEDLLPMAKQLENKLREMQKAKDEKNRQNVMAMYQRYAEEYSKQIAEKEAELAEMEHPYSKAAKELRSEIEQLQRKLGNVQQNITKQTEEANLIAAPMS